jgi:geranylgeranyl reductase family protein
VERCDALIVGGGPAGSTLARELVRSGLDVVVLDKASFPRDKVCAGWITPAVLAEVDLDPVEYAAGGRTIQEIRGFRVGPVGGCAVELAYDEAVSYGIRRCELDDFLLRRSGARLRLGRPLRSFERRDDRWVVNGEIETPLLVGAGGHFCPVARRLAHDAGADVPEEPIVAAQELELELDGTQAERCRVKEDTPELYFARDLKGYGWCFRKGDWLNVGLGRQDRERLPGHLQDFVGWLKQEGRIPGDWDGRYKGHAYLLYGDGSRPLVADGALLIGDAAGLAYPASGEGIRPAVESALLAAGVIRSARGFARGELEPYARALDERFRREGRSLSALLPVPLRDALALRLLETRWFTRRVVVERWFLHRHEAPLVAVLPPTVEGGASRAAAASSPSVG